MKINKLLTIGVLLVIISGCSPKVHLTQDIRKQIENNNIELKDVQFYIDRKIVLRRELKSGDVKVSSGQVKFENGMYVNEIVIRKYTPGICVSNNNESIVISFEEGKGNELSFGKQPVVYPVKTMIYQIQASDWNNNYGKVMYGNQLYVISPKGSEAQLLISKSELENSTFEKRVIKGVKIEE